MEKRAVSAEPRGEPSLENCSAAGGVDTAASKLEAHLSELDEPSLLRVARAVELARASERRDPTDERILECLRPRLKDLRPERLPTFQRAVCAHLEPFLFNGGVLEAKRRGWIPRSVLSGWWSILNYSPHGESLREAEAAYAAAVRAGRWSELSQHISQGTQSAAEATIRLVRDVGCDAACRAETLSILGSDQALVELQEIAAVLAVSPRITPALRRVREAAGSSSGPISDFAPAAVLAARSAYAEFHAEPSAVVEYFLLGLIQSLAQPWQALRLVRILSTDMSKMSDEHLCLIPTRLFNDLTRILGEIGRAEATGNGTSRRVWLVTCARLVSDATAMIKGLAEEGRSDENPEWNRRLGEARTRINAAVENFASLAVRDVCQVLPVRQIKDNGAEMRLEPDMCHPPTDEEVQTAQAAALLFVACRRYSDQEGLDRAFRPKEADLIHQLQIGVNFRLEFLRARMRHPVCLAQLAAMTQVIRLLPQTEPLTELTYRLERTAARYK